MLRKPIKTNSMRKLLFLILVLFLPSISLMFANTQSSPKKVCISKLTTGDIKTVRTPSSEEILCYYYESDEVIHSISLVDLGVVQVTVTNINTSEVWSDVFDSSLEVPHLLNVSSDPGNYVVTYTTESGDVYKGTFVVGNVLSVITYVYDAAGNRIGRGV